MRFVIDAQLPPALARLLTAQGHTAEHVADIGLRDADDSPIWAYALELQAIIVTKGTKIYRTACSRARPAR